MKTLVLIVAVILIPGCGTSGELPAANTVQNDLSSAGTAEEADTSAAVTEELPEETVPEPVEVTDDILYTLKSGIAGVFAVGSSENDTFEAALAYSSGTIEEIELMAEGMAYPALEMNFEDSGSILLELSDTDRTVSRIEINSPLFKTEEGIGIGSTYDDLLNNYSFDGISWGDGGDPLVVVEEAGMSFLLEPGDWWQMGEVQGDIPGNTEITSVLVW